MPKKMKRQPKADADEEQEAGGDGAREQLPAALGGHARRRVAEEFEVPGEVIDRHRGKGETAREVDRLKARSAAHGSLHRHSPTRKAAPRLPG
jgi:hypothetical protein